MYDYIHSPELLNYLIRCWEFHYGQFSMDTFEDNAVNNIACRDTLRSESALTALALRYSYQPLMLRRCNSLQTANNVETYEFNGDYWTYLEGRYYNIDYQEGHPNPSTPNWVPESATKMVRECIYKDYVNAAIIATFLMRCRVPVPDEIGEVMRHYPPTLPNTLAWRHWAFDKLSTVQPFE